MGTTGSDVNRGHAQNAASHGSGSQDARAWSMQICFFNQSLNTLKALAEAERIIDNALAGDDIEVEGTVFLCNVVKPLIHPEDP